MPFIQSLIDTEGYELHRYRCGIPSTTPFVQAGILYVDNSDIPSFLWWDREQQLLVQFGAGSTFKEVAGQYFQGGHPLTHDGASIAVCYPAGARDHQSARARCRARRCGRQGQGGSGGCG